MSSYDMTLPDRGQMTRELAAAHDYTIEDFAGATDAEVVAMWLAWENGADHCPACRHALTPADLPTTLLVDGDQQRAHLRCLLAGWTPRGQDPEPGARYAYLVAVLRPETPSYLGFGARLVRVVMGESHSYAILRTTSASNTRWMQNRLASGALGGVRAWESLAAAEEEARALAALR